MKSSVIALACLSLLLVAQDAAAKPSTPIANCRQKEIVPSDGSIQSCYDFADKYGTTFEKLLLWNTGLHKNCDNLDTDNEICVLGPAEGTEDITNKPSSPTGAGAHPMAHHATTGTQDSPTHSVDAASYKSRPVVTPARAAKYPKSSHAPVPAPAEQDAEIPEATPRPIKRRPSWPRNGHHASRPLYPDMPSGAAHNPKSHNVAP